MVEYKKTLTITEFLQCDDFPHFETEIIVCVGPRQTFNSIKNALQNLGLKKIHFLHDFYEFHSFLSGKLMRLLERLNRNGDYFKTAYATS